MRKKLIFPSVLIFLVVSIGGSGKAPNHDQWLSVRSKHLLLIGNTGEKELKQIADRLEQFREVISHLLSKPGTNSPVPTTVVVFKDDYSYQPFKTSENNAGFFQPGQDMNYITLSGEAHGDQEPSNIIFHEFTHLVVHNSIGSAPAWFNEGLAEFYSTLGIDGQTAVLGKPIRRHLNSLHQQTILPLRTLFEVDYESPYYNESQKQSIFYAESWALMHFFMLNNSGERSKQVLTFLQLLSNQVSLEEACQKAFATSFENLESEFRSYVQQDRYRSTERAFGPKVTTYLETTTRTLSEAEVEAYLGDLLVHSNRKEAESHLLRALQIDPGSTLANGALGILRFRQGRIQEALDPLERAVKNSSQNALVHYYYASALSQPRQDDTKLTLGYVPEVVNRARSALKKAIELRPDLTDAYNQLAYLNIVTSTDIDETIELLNSALTRLPNRIDLMYMLGQLYVHKDDYQRARPLIEQVIQGQVGPRVKRHAQKLLLTIDDLEKQQTQKDEARRARWPMTNPSDPTRAGTSDYISSDPSSDLREALRIPAESESQIQGILLSVECEPTGLIFNVRSGDRTLRLRSDSFQQVKRTTFTTDVKGMITCGERKPVNPVVVCFVPITDRRIKADGLLKSIEFVPASFRLVP